MSMKISKPLEFLIMQFVNKINRTIDNFFISVTFLASVLHYENQTKEIKDLFK